MARYDDLNTNAIAYTTFVSCVLLLLTILITQALCFNWLESREDFRVSKESYTSSDANIAAQKQVLEGYQWVEMDAPADQSKALPEANKVAPKIKKLQIPLERATELILKSAQPQEASPKT